MPTPPQLSRPAAPTLSRFLRPVESGPGAGTFVHHPTRPDLVLPGKEFGEWVDSLQSYRDQLAKAGAKRVMGNFYSTITQLSSVLTRGEAKPGKYPFSYLRQVRWDNPLAKLIIAVRMYQATRYSRRVLEYGRAVGWRVLHRNETSENTATGTGKVDKRRQAVVDMLENPAHTPIHNSLTDVFAILANDYLTYGRVACVRMFTTKQQMGSWALLDPTSVRHLTAVPNEDIEAAGYTSADEIRSQMWTAGDYKVQPYAPYGGLPMLDLKGKQWAQFMNGSLYWAWDEREISVGMINRRSELNWGYNGEGIIEQVAELLDSWLTIFRWNEANYQREYPDNILFFPGADDGGALLEEWANEAKVISQGINGLLLAPIGSRDELPEMVSLGINPKDMEHMQNFMMLTSLILAAFQMHPYELNLSPWQGGEGVNYNGAAQSDSLKEQKSAGEEGMLTWIADFLTEAVIKPFDPDFRLQIDTELVDPNARAQEMEQLAASGFSYNQVMNAYGFDPRKNDPVADLPQNQAYFQWVQFQAMQQQQAQQMQMQQQQMQAQQQGQPPDAPDGAATDVDPNTQAQLQQKQDDSDANRQHDMQMQAMQQAHEKEMLKLKQAHELKLARAKGRQGKGGLG